MNKTFLWNLDFTGGYLDHDPRVRGWHQALLVEASLRATPGLPATWGGILRSAHAFTASHWKRIMGEGGGRRALDKVVAAGLARWVGGDLEVALYHLKSEASYMKVAHGEGGPKPKPEEKDGPPEENDAPPTTQPPEDIDAGRVAQFIPQPIPHGRGEAGRGGVGMARLSPSGPEGLPSGTGTGGPPLQPMELIHHFEWRYEQEVERPYIDAGGGQREIQKLLDAMETSRGLLDDVDSYVAQHKALATLGGFPVWLVEREEAATDSVAKVGA